MVSNKVAEVSLGKKSMKMTASEEGTSQRNCCNRLTDFIIGKFENFFFG